MQRLNASIPSSEYLYPETLFSKPDSSIPQV